MTDEDKIVAIGLLTRRDLEMLGSAFSRVFPLDENSGFDGLLIAIDEADRTLRQARDARVEDGRE